jgi:hypothetical protein
MKTPEYDDHQLNGTHRNKAGPEALPKSNERPKQLEKKKMLVCSPS